MHALLLAVCCLVSGHIHTAGGSPIAAAHISVRGRAGGSTTSDATGAFAVTVAPGDYQLNVTAKGYVGATVDVTVEKEITVDVALQPFDAPTLRTIAAVSVDGRLAPVRGTIPSITVTRSEMEQVGDTRVVQAIETLPGAVLARPDGGNAAAPAVVALRGPDPSESLVTLDGQTLNDGNTGDVDLSRLPLGAFSAINVTEGLGPEDQNGSNTFGGALNLVSLQPTKDPHFAFQESAGSWNQSEVWLNATGTHRKLGYAFAIDDQHQRGYANEVVPLYSSADPACAPCLTPLGSTISSHAMLANLTYAFSQRANASVRVFALGNVRDESAAINGIDGNAASPTFGQFIGPGNQTLAQNLRAYQVRGQMPLGAGDLTGEISADDDAVNINGLPSNPAYDVTHVDRRANLALNWQRSFDGSEYAIGGYTRYESLSFLDPVNATQKLGQSIASYYVRGGVQATKELKLEGAVFASHYTTFGSNLDGRFGAIYNLNPKTALRFSVGTGFRAPLLIERYVFPLGQLAQDQYGVFLGQGNPNERPERATEYELGFSHEFPTAATLDVSLYRSNLRDPIEIYYPFQLTTPVNRCAGNAPSTPIPGCLSYNSNNGNAVYEGAEVRFVQRFVPQHLFLTAMYGLNVAYPKDFTENFSNPTSGANLVNYQQFAGIPQQQGSLELDWANKGWHAAANAIFRGNDNWLGRGPFTIVNAAVGFKMNAMTDITLAATNIGNDAAGRYTVFGGGVPYPGLNGPIPTDRLGVEPFGLTFLVTVRE